MLEPTPSIRDITIFQGQTYTDKFQLKLDTVPADFTGCSAEWVCKEKLTDAEDSAFLSSKSPISNVTITLAANGYINVSITDEVTDMITQKKGVYALYIHWADTSSWRLFEGNVTISKGA